MKTTLFLLCLLFAPAAFAQYYSAGHIDSQPVIYEGPSHPEHAAYAPMRSEQSVIASTSYSSAQGERPASDFPQAEGVPLGTYAREWKKQHAHLKRSSVVWVNQ